MCPGPDNDFFDAPFRVLPESSEFLPAPRAESAHLAHHRPRFTVSIQTVERSTLGTAGFKREMANRRQNQPSAEAAIIMRRLRFSPQLLHVVRPSRKDSA